MEYGPIISRSVLDVWGYLGVDFMGVSTVAASGVGLGKVLGHSFASSAGTSEQC